MHAARTLLRPLQTLAPAAARQMTVLPAMGGGKEHFCVETLTLTRKAFARIQGVPAGARKASVIVDAAMNDLIRPSLYGAYHAVQPVVEAADSAPWTPCDIVGPGCESGDFLARDRNMPSLAPGDLVAIRCAGAYGREMASSYNARRATAEVFVEDGGLRQVRARGDYATLWAGEED